MRKLWILSATTHIQNCRGASQSLIVYKRVKSFLKHVIIIGQTGASCKITLKISPSSQYNFLLKFLLIYRHQSSNKAFTHINWGKRLIYFVSNVTCKPGEMVATYSNNGWTMYTTNAEASRQTEMCMIYNEAWGNAKRGIPLAGEEAVGVENPQNSFDAKA